MRLCVGTAKGIVILDPDRVGAPLMVRADPSPIWCMAQDCRDPDLIYAGATQFTHVGAIRGATTLSRSTDGGGTWTDISPRIIREDDVCSIATPPDGPNEVFIGTPRARLLKSIDRGRTFDECKAFLKVPGRERWSSHVPPGSPHVRSISFDPSNPSTMYIGVEEGGVVRSRDGGKRFEALNKGICPDVHCVIVDPHDPKRLYATTGRGVYRSENDGASWRHSTAGMTRCYTVPLAVHPRTDGLLYTAAAAGPPPSWATSMHGADAMMFRSLDHGKTFEPIVAKEGPMRAMVMRLVQSPRNADELFAVLGNGTVMRSRDCGESFVAIASRLPSAYDMVILP